MTFSESGLYFQWGGEAQTISYVTKDAKSVALKSTTDGWTCKLDTTTRTITITAVTPDADGTLHIVLSGTDIASVSIEPVLAWPF